MERLIVISAIFALIAQAMGVVSYYSQRHQYSKSAQNVITLVPALAFVVMASVGALLWLFLAWWSEVEGISSRLFNGKPPLLLGLGIYLTGGAVANIFLSILVQLVILLIHPPKYKLRRRRRRRSESAQAAAPNERQPLSS